MTIPKLKVKIMSYDLLQTYKLGMTRNYCPCPVLSSDTSSGSSLATFTYSPFNAILQIAINELVETSLPELCIELMQRLVSGIDDLLTCLEGCGEVGTVSRLVQLSEAKLFHLGWIAALTRKP